MKPDGSSTRFMFIRVILLVLILGDLGYSFYQHFHMSLGGDFGDNIAPTPERGFYQVLRDPLGLGVLLEDRVYSNPNKFFAHWTVYHYFRTVPIFLQHFTKPIDSLYWSSALVKILIQVFILYLLSVYISNRKNPLDLDFLTAAALMFPLFQTWGYNRYMGIIDQSVIYTFFYALPIALLLLFFLPFYRKLHYGAEIRFNVPRTVLLALGIPVLALNGPLIPGIVLIACPLVMAVPFWKKYRGNRSRKSSGPPPASMREIPAPAVILFSFFILFSLYSLYIGRNNALTIQDSFPLLSRYAKLPGGFYALVTSKLGFPLLFLAIAFNLWVILRFHRTPGSQKMVFLLKWMGVFALLYILMLPLGGYRSYRPDVLRYDTFIPVTLCVFFAFGATSVLLIKALTGRLRTLYLAGIIALLLMIQNADRLDLSNYQCERRALEKIAASPDSIVVLNEDCNIMDWSITADPEIRQLDADLLHFWNVTDRKKLFYQVK
jgi:hypothetical protein